MAEPMPAHSGIAAILMRDNIDTDQIIPSREMRSVDRKGLGEGLFAGWRYTDPAARVQNPEFVLNRPEQAGTSVLISGENFGCGSSREHAVWALQEYGIRVVIAKSFGEIFHGNCIRNGILPVTLTIDEISELASLQAPLQLDVDLTAQTLTYGSAPDQTVSFEISEFAKRLLVEGLDPIAMTLSRKPEIDAFFERDASDRPWAYSAA